MLKIQYICVGIAIGMIIFLYTLPKSVVSNKKDFDTSVISSQKGSSSVSDSLKNTVYQLANAFYTAKTETIALNILDRLTDTFISLNLYDSATKYVDLFAEKYPNKSSYLKAGNLFYQAYTSSTDSLKAFFFSRKARMYLEKAYVLSPDIEIKAKIGVTYIASSNLMKGIFLLREVLEEKPNHHFSLLYLGILCLHSGQYEKAKERLTVLTELDPDHLEAKFYLALALKALQEKNTS